MRGFMTGVGVTILAQTIIAIAVITKLALEGEDKE